MKWLILALFLGCSSSQLDSKVEAEKAATAWFSNLDKGYFSKVFLESSPYLRDRLNKSTMDDMLTRRLLMLGKNKLRTKTAEETLSKYRGLGRGEYISLDYLSEFELRSSVSERVVLKKDKGSWRVFDYFIL